MEKFYSTFEAAKICRVSPGSIIRWIKEGRLAASLTAGGHHRIAGPDLQKFLKELKLPDALESGVPQAKSEEAKQGPVSLLVIDDEILICRLLHDELTRRGYRVTVAVNGAEGLKKASKEKFPLAICDVVMPEMNGVQFLEEVKKISPETEVILLTAHADVETAVDAMRKGAYDFVQKPFNRAEFFHRIENALEKQSLKETLKNYEIDLGLTQGKIRKLEEAKYTLEQTQEELIRIEKLNSIGRFVTGIAHEINNPLTSIIGYSQLLLDCQPPENMVRPLNIMHEQAKRCGKIVQDLMVFASPKKLDAAQWVIASAFIEAALKDLDSEICEKGVEVIFKRKTQESGSVWVEAARIQQVFYDILKNAIQAVEDVAGIKRITIEIEESRGTWRAVFSDTGPGVPAEIHRKIFDPFFTTKEVGKGTGLGLSKAFGIVREHGGQITLKSEPGKGAAFCVELPLRLQRLGGQENFPSASAA